MKKQFFFAAVALVALASCSSEDFVGDSPTPNHEISDAIVFEYGANTITRANKTGADAANELNNKFVVGGFKGATSVATTTVFDNYNVEYTANTANTTESNTHNWEYVGLDQNALSSIYVSGEKQTIKYWDYSQAQYDFIAYSLGNGGATATKITPSTATSSTGGAYTISGTTAQLKTVHIADLVTVLKADYNKVVNLTFRSMISKVRIGLYETVPGYSVKDVKFYTSDDAISGGSTSATAALYTSTALPTAGTYTVYFPTVNSATPTTDKNKAHVAFTTSTSTSDNQTFGTLEESGTLVNSQKYEYKEDKAETPTHTASTKYLLGRESNHATFAGAAPHYVEVLPLETGASLTLKVDYTLVSIDGSGENIKVVGAKAVVPAIYAQWKPGYAYTYLFKISDNSNGYTSGVESSEIQGLHPITFDAIVETAIEDKIQETVTTVATPSITTYQHVPAVNVTANDEYVAGTVYAMVMDGGTLKTDLNGTTTPSAKDPAKLYSLTELTNPSEADVMDALIMQADVSGTTITGRNGLVLTAGTIDNEIHDEGIPGADGNTIDVADGAASKLTVEAGKTYAYVYTATASTTNEKVYHVAAGVTDAASAANYYEVKISDIATTACAAGATAAAGNVYFVKSGSDTYTFKQTKVGDNVEGLYAATIPVNKASTYTAGSFYFDVYNQNNGIYAVKVIKVASGS